MILKSMGLELRRINDISVTYEQVDKILESFKDPERQTLAHGLQDMLQPDNSPSVCFIREAQKLCNIVIPEKHMEIYSMVHCMKWNKMTDEYRNFVVALILNDFRSILMPEEEGSNERV